MTAKSRRLIFVVVICAILGSAGYLILNALNQNIILFFSPSDITDQQKQGQRLRLGGLVEEGSVQIDGLQARFSITDGLASVKIAFDGALPDLFREGQGIVAQGSFSGDIFQAENVLAKHDENYMPREIADSLKEKGVWQGDIQK
jgi:cytochrome c-type biogenesis protein CcmE